MEVEPLADGGNDAVLRLPGRTHPGVLIQGDTLGIRRADAAEPAAPCAAGDLEEALHAAALLRADLDSTLQHHPEA
ncbi:DUF6959 family protein [Streptomyces omiyaensis]|uniref:DUF6959 family protein n=1 Tax=Streptomyces omiyaensis TaxID=68247 RepID=A0ABW7BYZ6_9ACTN|nr:hypothetical protein [Streptomyces omiyaensis]GGY66237.1 hypothetical protein GCM10010363_54410 [Streptomyces omiyaensis]